LENVLGKFWKFCPSTVGYPSDSWASCYFPFTLLPRQGGRQGGGFSPV